jgi:hypothetical protein
MNSDFRSAAERIEANPLGRLMYGNRELFHSNLIAWFFDVLPEAADAVFRPLTVAGPGKPRKVHREAENLDLVFDWPDAAPLVIENKVFSLPNKAQLDLYAAKVAKWGSDAQLVLLSASSPSFAATGWHYLSYADLADRIDEALLPGNSYELETMRRYAALARDLHALLELVSIESAGEPVWMSDAQLDVISSSQMRGGLVKARGRRVAELINREIPGLEQPSDSGFTRNTPLVEALEYVYAYGAHMHAGWQLQGRQFRLVVVFHDESVRGKSVASRNAREQLARSMPRLFAFPAALAGRSGRNEFNHFAPAFVYQWSNAAAITVSELIEAAKEVHHGIEALRVEFGPGPQRPVSAVRVAP